MEVSYSRLEPSLKHIIITGASSGIGRALALHYAGPGICLGLIGRDLDRLKATAEAATKAGASCQIASIDVTDAEGNLRFIQDFDRDLPIDLLIANAGILDGRREDQLTEDAEIARRVIDINLTGSITSLHAALPGMRVRKSGHIVLVSSLAAFNPLADAPAYSASKAGQLFYGLALREALAPTGIKVTVVAPGYVATPMSQQHIGAHPFEISAETAARLIARGIARNKAIIGFPSLMYFGSRFSIFLPEWFKRLTSKALRFHVKTP